MKHKYITYLIIAGCYIGFTNLAFSMENQQNKESSKKPVIVKNNINEIKKKLDPNNGLGKNSNVSEMLDPNKFNWEYKKTKIALKILKFSKYDENGKVYMDEDQLSSVIYDYNKNNDNPRKTAKIMLQQATHQVTSFLKTYYPIPEKQLIKRYSLSILNDLY